jgi:hypothetical protein
MSALASITNALLSHPDLFLLPRWRVIADVRERFACSDWVARTAYADARVIGHRRNRRSTIPHARMAA